MTITFCVLLLNLSGCEYKEDFMMKFFALAIITIITGADIGDVTGSDRFTSSYQELAPAPTTDPVAPYLTPDVTPCPAPDNSPEPPSWTESNAPSHNEMEITPALTADNAPAAPNEEDGNQPSHDDAPAAPTEEATNNPGHNDQPQEPQPASANCPSAPAEATSNEPAHNGLVSEIPAPVVEFVTNDTSDIPAHCNVPVE